MQNAVKKMFALALFEPLKYFPKHATCPDKFWDIIQKTEEKFGHEICLESLAARPTKNQIRVAKKFNHAFRRVILTNPTGDFFSRVETPTAEEINSIMEAYRKFDCLITSLFENAMEDLMQDRS